MYNCIDTDSCKSMQNPTVRGLHKKEENGNFYFFKTVNSISIVLF
jgi:hypothetical protein